MRVRVPRIVFYLAAVAVAVGLGLGGRVLLLRDADHKMPTSPPPAAGVTIGGPFALVDPTGATVTDADLRGRFVLLYFGFTYCPDACPTALAAMADALDLLGEKAERVVPVFISVDPERDTAERLGEYVRHFHPRLVGLTGTPEQIAAVARAYRVYYAKVQANDAAKDDYTVDHTSIIYVMNPDGSFHSHFPGHTTSAEAMAKRLRSLL